MLQQTNNNNDNNDNTRRTDSARSDMWFEQEARVGVRHLEVAVVDVRVERIALHRSDRFEEEHERHACSRIEYL
jgi:hypothetical protein